MDSVIENPTETECIDATSTNEGGEVAVTDEIAVIESSIDYTEGKAEDIQVLPKDKPFFPLSLPA